MRCVVLSVFLASSGLLSQAPQVLTVDAGRVVQPHSATPLNTVGAGRANEGLRADWQEQLTTLQREIGFHYLRFHGLLHDDMGVYTEDDRGNPVYNFQYVDALYDAMLARHVRPFVELSFMPSALASDGRTVFWWKGNISPPKDMTKWNGLIRALMTHWKRRYGEAEIDQWYYEVWNEPNLHDGFFTGSQAEYFELYRNTAEDVRGVCARCRVGGPATAGGAWEADWLRYVAANHAPADFLSTHTYAVTQGAFDATGQAGTVLDTRPDAIVGDVRRARAAIEASSTGAASPTPKLELHFTEWSSSYTATDPVHDQYIEAAFILSKLRATAPLAQSMSYWTFTDIFEENGPPTRPFHGGFGLMNLQGIRKPAYFAYKYLAELGAEDVGTSDAEDSWATTKQDGSVQVLFWDYTAIAPPQGQNDQEFYRREQPAVALPPRELVVDHLRPGRYRMVVHRTGYRENDAYTAYLRMGAPWELTRAQVSALQQATDDTPAQSRDVQVKNGTFRTTFTMRQNDTVLVTLTPVPQR